MVDNRCGTRVLVFAGASIEIYADTDGIFSFSQKNSTNIGGCAYMNLRFFNRYQ